MSRPIHYRSNTFARRSPCGARIVVPDGTPRDLMPRSSTDLLAVTCDVCRAALVSRPDDTMHAAAMEHVRALAIAGDWHGIIRALSGSNHSTETHLWALAMTARYGPTGLHDSYFTDGLPDPAKCGPRVMECMSEAGAQIRRLLGVAS